MAWKVHVLQAEGSLEPWRDQLIGEIRALEDKLAIHLGPERRVPDIDIVLQRVAERTIPELGLAGHTLRRSCMVITLDPDNPNYAASLAAGQLTRIVTHEYHHCLRADRIGFGTTLEDALVSEGLADHFDREINGGDGQLWTRALVRKRWPALLDLAEQTFAVGHYSHELWFFGLARNQISVIPRWAGYSIGYALVGAYLKAQAGARPSNLIATPASAIVARAWPILRAGYQMRDALSQ